MSDSLIDQTIPGDKWEFNSDVAHVFDNMLERSIPQYAVMRKAVFDLGSKYVKPGTDIVDVGCSRGEAIADLVDRFGAQNRFTGLEVSEPMLEEARKRFEGYLASKIVTIKSCDLRTDYPFFNASLTLSVFTLQFVPIEYRQRLVARIFQGTQSGGAFILVEKVLGATANLDLDMVMLYYMMKAENGYSQEQIERKRLALEGVLVPVTAKWNEDLLHQAGFNQVDCFWRWMNFAGWIAVKP